MNYMSTGKTGQQQDATDQPTKLPAMVPSIDADCLACLDLGRQLPHLPDNVMEAILELLPSEVARCLVASKLSYSWCFTQHYLLDIRLGFQLEYVFGKLPITRKSVQDTLDFLRKHEDAVATPNSVCELADAVEECYNGIDSVAAHAKVQLADVQRSGCSRYLWWKSGHLQEFAENLLDAVDEQRQMVSQMLLKIKSRLHANIH